jgi:hypothetical protein
LNVTKWIRAPGCWSRSAATAGLATTIDPIPKNFITTMFFTGPGGAANGRDSSLPAASAEHSKLPTRPSMRRISLTFTGPCIPRPRLERQVRAALAGVARAPRHGPARP